MAHFNSLEQNSCRIVSTVTLNTMFRLSLLDVMHEVFFCSNKNIRLQAYMYTHEVMTNLHSGRAHSTRVRYSRGKGNGSNLTETTHIKKQKGRGREVRSNEHKLQCCQDLRGKVRKRRKMCKKRETLAVVNSWLLVWVQVSILSWSPVSYGEPATTLDARQPSQVSNSSLAGLSPAVRLLLETYELDPRLIPATGPKGRLLKGDVLRFVAQGGRPFAKPGESLTDPSLSVPPPPAAAPAVTAQPQSGKFFTFAKLDILVMHCM